MAGGIGRYCMEFQGTIHEVLVRNNEHVLRRDKLLGYSLTIVSSEKLSKVLAKTV